MAAVKVIVADHSIDGCFSAALCKLASNNQCIFVEDCDWVASITKLLKTRIVIESVVVIGTEPPQQDLQNIALVLAAKGIPFFYFSKDPNYFYPINQIIGKIRGSRQSVQSIFEDFLLSGFAGQSNSFSYFKNDKRQQSLLINLFQAADASEGFVLSFKYDSLSLERLAAKAEKLIRSILWHDTMPLNNELFCDIASFGKTVVAYKHSYTESLFNTYLAEGKLCGLDYCILPDSGISQNKFEELAKNSGYEAAITYKTHGGITTMVLFCLSQNVLKWSNTLKEFRQKHKKNTLELQIPQNVFIDMFLYEELIE